MASNKFRKSVRFDEKMNEDIKRVAEMEGITENRLIEIAIEKYVHRETEISYQVIAMLEAIRNSIKKLSKEINLIAIEQKTQLQWMMPFVTDYLFKKHQISDDPNEIVKALREYDRYQNIYSQWKKHFFTKYTTLIEAELADMTVIQKEKILDQSEYGEK